jgi:hypothetical protein
VPDQRGATIEREALMYLPREPSGGAASFSAEFVSRTMCRS